MEPPISRELEQMPDEPLLPIERKLIIVSLMLGVALLGLLWWVSVTYFNITPG